MRTGILDSPNPGKHHHRADAGEYQHEGGGERRQQ
jgi:hypothetical protein